jgi:bacterioferritin-associated ferredoxin
MPEQPVIVCVCHRVSDRDIEAHACKVRSFGELQARTQLGTQCGSCRECAEEIFTAAARSANRHAEETDIAV